jgi:hypothetical protein
MWEIFEFPEETQLTVYAKRGLVGKSVVWSIGKRGTVFLQIPNTSSTVDWFKDLTHLYRDKTTGKKRGRREWATTFWVETDAVQQILTAAEEATHTKNHYARCGCESIQWSQVERRRNRVVNPGTGLQYPLVSEELWVKHIGSKKFAKS